MRITIYRSVLAASVAFLLSYPLDAQTIRGVVIDAATGRPLADASVVLLDKNGDLRRGTLSDVDGSYSIRAPEPGRYTLRVGRSGYITWDSAPVKLGADATVELDLRTQPEGGVAGGLEVFDGRRARGEGMFLTAEEIKERGGSRFTDVLRNTAGVVIVPMPMDTLPMDTVSGRRQQRGQLDPEGRQTVQRFTVRLQGAPFDLAAVGARHVGERGSDCPPVLYVDGSWWGDIDEAGELGPDPELLPGNLAAIEIYTPSVVPEELEAGRAYQCGVIVVWRKRR